MGFTGPNDALQLLGVTLIGVTPENGRKRLLTVAFVLLTWLAGRLIGSGLGAVTHGVRDLKDAMTREILASYDAADIQIASATFEIVGLPPLKITRAP